MRPARAFRRPWRSSRRARRCGPPCSATSPSPGRGAAGPGLAETGFGDVAVGATWDAGSGVDLDVGIVDPSGRRLSWASAARGVRASDCTSTGHEALAVTSGATGPFLVEVVRADGAAAE